MLGYQQSHGQVQGLDSNPVEVCGGATVTIDVGWAKGVSGITSVSEWLSYPYTWTRFFYENSIYHIRLGDIWKETKANTRGGSAISRATVAHLISQVDNSNVETKWNINQNLFDSEKRRSQYILRSFEDVFAVNPKIPSLTFLAEHRIETNHALPVKARAPRIF